MYNTLYHTCMYNRPPEDESSGSKHVEDISVVKVQFVGLCCIIILFFVACLTMTCNITLSANVDLF